MVAAMSDGLFFPAVCSSRDTAAARLCFAIAPPGETRDQATNQGRKRVVGNSAPFMMIFQEATAHDSYPHTAQPHSMGPGFCQR
jgi:hypothetical protein